MSLGPSISIFFSAILLHFQASSLCGNKDGNKTEAYLIHTKSAGRERSLLLSPSPSLKMAHNPHLGSHPHCWTGMGRVQGLIASPETQVLGHESFPRVSKPLRS